MYSYLATRFFLFSFRKNRDDGFWDWLFKRACSASTSDFKDRRAVWFLFSHALEEGEHFRVVAVFSYFRDIIEPDLTPRFRERLEHSIGEAEELQRSAGDE